MKIRVTAAMKADFQKLATARSTAAQTVSESDLAREAFVQYLDAHANELKETSVAAAPPPGKPATPVNYGNPAGTARTSSSTGKRSRVVEILKARRRRTEGTPGK
jgi:hypothetical protein